MHRRVPAGSAAPTAWALLLAWALVQQCAVVVAVPGPTVAQDDSGNTNTSSDPFTEYVKECLPECHLHGNCNGETGQCDCPFGYAGTTCTERYLPACHSSWSNDTQPHCGQTYPKNCECFVQLHQWACPQSLQDQLGQDREWCVRPVVPQDEFYCYRYKGLPNERQLSDSPALDDPRVAWYKATGRFQRRARRPAGGGASGMETYVKLQARQVPAQEAAQAVQVLPWRGMLYQPLNACPERCRERGWCVRSSPDSPPQCACHGTWGGPTCEQPLNEECPLGCSGVGVCLEGWCHCQAGYWGPGCTRTRAYSSVAGWLPNPAALRVYVYALPTRLVHRFPARDVWGWGNAIYGAERPFLEALLADREALTHNPWEASLFYVPAYSAWHSNNVASPLPLLTRLHAWLSTAAPFWNLTGGRNHVWQANNDRSMCTLYGAPLHVQKPIAMVHFGQAGRPLYPRVPFKRVVALSRGMAQQGQRPKRQEAAGKGPVVVMPVHGEEARPGWRGMPANLSREALLAESQPCYRPEKDIVIPPHASLDTVMVAREATYEYRPGADAGGGGGGAELRAVRREAAGQRNATFFFAGGNSQEMGYSQGVRQTIFAMFGPGGRYDPAGPNARHDYHVPTSGEFVVQYDAMRQAKFCLAPTGFGWGIRVVEAVMCGCVPVIIQDYTYQPLWDVLPYHEFSLRLPRRDLHRLVELLDAVSPQQLARLQRGVDKWHRAFLWPTPEIAAGLPLAYHYSMEALWRRAINLNSELYRHRRLSS